MIRSKAKKQDAVRRLQGYLESLESKGKLHELLWKGGLNRKLLARETGLSYASLVWNSSLTPILAEFTEKLRSGGYFYSRWDSLPGKVRDHLTKLLALNQLPISWLPSRPIICRQEIATAFGFPHQLYSNNHELRAVMLEFDAKIDPKLYPRTSKYDYLEKPLHEFIASGKSPVYRGRIHREALAAEFGVDPAVLKFVPKLAKIVAEGDKAIREKNRHRLRADNPPGEENTVEIDPKVNGQRFDFSKYVEKFGLTFALKLVNGFTEIATRYALGTAGGFYSILVLFLDFACEHSVAFCDEAKRGVMQRDTLESIAWEWRESLLVADVSIGLTTACTRIKALNSILAGLSDAQVFPEVFPLPGIPNARRQTLPRPTFAQMSHGDRANVILARENVAKSEQAAFLRTLEQERVREKDLPKDSVKAMEQVNRRRLARLRDIAVKVLLKCYKHFLEGQRILTSSDLTGEQVWERIRLLGDSSAARAAGLGIIFPKGEEIERARFLKFFVHRWGTDVTQSLPKDELGAFWPRRITRYGGAQQLLGYLTATTDALVAAITIFLIDSGANLGVARELSVDCMEEHDVPGFKRIVGYKARAQGHPIHFDLPVSSKEHSMTAIKALEIIKEMTVLLRKEAKTAANHLFLARCNENKIQAIPCAKFTNGFKKMIAGDDVLGGLNLRPCMIRPSFLMDIALRNNGELLEAKLKAAHKNAATTNAYTNHYPTRLLYEQKMRNFQAQFQAVIVVNISNAAKKLGLTELEMERRLLEASRNGLGVFCPASSRKAEKITDAGSKKEDCVESAQMLVLAYPENLADVIMLNESLNIAMAEHETSRPERLESVLLPWLAFTNTVIEQITRGPHAILFAAAKRLVEKRKATGFELPVPW